MGVVQGMVVVGMLRLVVVVGAGLVRMLLDGWRRTVLDVAGMVLGVVMVVVMVGQLDGGRGRHAAAAAVAGMGVVVVGSRRGPGHGASGALLLGRGTAAALLLEDGVVGEEVAARPGCPALFQGGQVPPYVVRPEVLEDGAELLVGGPRAGTGLVDLATVVVGGKAPAMQEGTANLVVPQGDFLAGRHGPASGVLSTTASCGGW